MKEDEEKTSGFQGIEKGAQGDAQACVLPHRVQRQRIKGWRMPENTIYVGRPTRYGNPYWHAETYHGGQLSLALFENTAQGIWNPTLLDRLHDGAARMYYEDHLNWTKRFGRHPLEVIRAELRGHNLACWCRLDAPCHADILLRLAND